MKDQKTKGIKLIASNRKAHFEYFLSDFLECGIELQGTEIKSIRMGHASLSDSYVIIKGSEAFLMGMNISEYEKGNIFNHDPNRTRKLLIHKFEIRKYAQAIQEKGFTLIATKLYLKNGKAKLEIALAKGKNIHDKRETIKKREDTREMEKAFKNYNGR